MALVDYSDSEGDDEVIPAVEVPKSAPTTKAAFQKAAPGKIKVDLPSLKPELPKAQDPNTDEPSAKRARTGGAFSGFNSLLPAPKKAAPNAAKARFSLKTSSEAAFSRNPLPAPAEDDIRFSASDYADAGQEAIVDTPSVPTEEPKLTGKATRFLPLSVSNKKKKKPKETPSSTNLYTDSKDVKQRPVMPKSVSEHQVEEMEPVVKPKRSLFAVDQEEVLVSASSDNTPYEPIMVDNGRQRVPEDIEIPHTSQQPASFSNPSSLEATAADLNLTAAQRRQLFGRRAAKDANVMHFNLDSEYAANEVARQAGEVIEHRAVKAIAPGKHSLQQLVNNARSQQDAMEDKWAEGRRAKGEGGSKYGWTS